jgi:hypothetical protein
MIVQDGNKLWVRQSWLDTANRCPERARRAIVQPEWDLTSDLALVGTVTHHAIQQHLDGADGTVDSWIAEGLEQYQPTEMRWTKLSTTDEIVHHATACTHAWMQDLAPNVTPGGRTEVTFEVPLWEQHGYQVGIRGTIDYISPRNELWDWKTSSSMWKREPKQKHAIQPTVYALAAIKGGLESDGWTLPLEFHFGVITRAARPKTQIVTVYRDEDHLAWLERRIRSWVNLFVALGVEQEWPMNDDHFLCNDTWCPWWSVCKGAHMSRRSDVVPSIS